jgi:hypothetical protein
MPSECRTLVKAMPNVSPPRPVRISRKEALGRCDLSALFYRQNDDRF